MYRVGALDEVVRSERHDRPLFQIGEPGTLEGGDVSIGGIIGGMRLIKTRKGDRMASFVLEDTEGSVEALVFPSSGSRGFVR